METAYTQKETSLYKLWESAMADLQGKKMKVTDEDWHRQVFHLSEDGIGMEEALQYLYNQQPTFEAFWLWATSKGVKNNVDDSPYTDEVLSDADKAFWDENGYIVIRNAVSAEQCAAARAAIWESLGAKADNPDSWYASHPSKNGLMLSFFQHEALDKNRNSQKIKKAFSKIYESTEIYLLIDKVSFNPPETADYKFAGSPLHWDVSLQLPIPFVLQGLLYLNDVSAEDGAFHCVPGFHKQIDNWIADLPESINPREAAIKELTPVAVPGNAGDLVIWHQALPHCATPNKGITPRMVQYITYKPLQEKTAEIWK
ncbi:MAG TPA: phytanoyl-CoA dioxygenase family protein [Mucilaginibacter sp.]